MSPYRLLVVGQLVVILLLVWYVLTLFAPRVEVSPVQNTDFAHNPQSKYEYFYEPVAGSTFSAYGANATINADTLNDARSYPHEKNDSEFRIIVLGDSFTFGYGVWQQEAFPAALGNMLNNSSYAHCSKTVEVFNLGVPGYDLAYEVERFRLRGLSYQPDLVVWQVSQRDLAENADDTQRLMKMSSTSDAALDWDAVAKNYHLTVDTVTYQKKAVDTYKKLYDGPTVLLNFHPPATLSQLFYESLVSARSHFSLLDLSVRNGYLSLFDARTDYLPDLHLNANGNGKVARALADYLLEQKLIPCEKL